MIPCHQSRVQVEDSKGGPLDWGRLVSPDAGLCRWVRKED